mmetsp:Transcript_15225/g.40988  ORF Transcript_15225/g.40988 Transcript_15225/m.40988 type:complete len:85 (+) Transcript_15225:909-1163(+)
MLERQMIELATIGQSCKQGQITPKLLGKRRESPAGAFSLHVSQQHELAHVWREQGQYMSLKNFLSILDDDDVCSEVVQKMYMLR